MIILSLAAYLYWAKLHENCVGIGERRNSGAFNYHFQYLIPVYTSSMYTLWSVICDSRHQHLMNHLALRMKSLTNMSSMWTPPTLCLLMFWRLTFWHGLISIQIEVFEKVLIGSPLFFSCHFSLICYKVMYFTACLLFLLIRADWEPSTSYSVCYCLQM